MRPLLRTAARPLRRAAVACLRMRASSTGALWTKLNELGARPGAINMGQGFPDFAGSAVARDAAKAALDLLWSGRTHLVVRSWLLYGYPHGWTPTT